MVYDCFTFFNELDVLEIRLNVLDAVVDRFVLVEAVKTHTGLPKPLYFAENQDRFARFKDRIVHVVVEDFPVPPAEYTERDTSWLRENFQRNEIIRGLKDACPDDIVVISDVDEIPDPAALDKFRKGGCHGVTALGLEAFGYYLNFKNCTNCEITTPRILTYATLCDPKTCAGLRPEGNLDAFVNRGTTTTAVRYMTPTRILRHAGWHFSYLGGAEAVRCKIRAIAIEYANEKSADAEWISDMIGTGRDVTGCGGRYFAVPLDERFPDYVRTHRERYASLIYEPPPDYYERTQWPRRMCVLRGWIRRYGARMIPRPFKRFLYEKVYSKLVDEPIDVIA